MIEVFGVDVGDDRDGRGQLEERAVALVGLGDEEIPGAEAGVRAQRVDLTADDDRRVEAGLAQHSRHERCGRRLSVGPGDRHAVLHAHQLGEHLRTGDDGDLMSPRTGDLWIAGLDGAREDHDVRAFHVRRPVPFMHDDAEAFEATSDVASLEVRA